MARGAGRRLRTVERLLKDLKEGKEVPKGRLIKELDGYRSLLLFLKVWQRGLK
ncbi:hypothetical protein LR013_06245 [candidate division NPL-UPA2 bacterium]|nr:hypothetical protein [candidate division NPL-UPA2 bacterium]